MYEDLKKAREKRASLLTKCQELHDQAAKETRNMTADEEKQFDAFWADAETERRNIERLEKLHEVSNEMRSPANPDDPHGMTKEEQSQQNQKVLRRYLLKGIDDFKPEERSILFDKESGKPSLRIEGRAAQTVTTTGGGYLIQTTLDDVLTKALKAYGGVRKACPSFMTAQGNPMDFATIDDTSNKGILLGINTQETEQALTFGKVTFYAFKFSSKFILLPHELIADEKIDLNQYLGDLLGERVGRIEADYMTTGTGSSEPYGIVTGATVGKALASASAITKDNLIDLFHSVDPAYRESPGCGWMFNDTTYKAIFKLSLGTATDLPLFSAPLANATNADGMAPTMFGKPYFINQSMADIGTHTKPILFGDFNRFKIRDVEGFRMLRLVERFADYDQIGVLLLHRADSRLMTSGAIKYLYMGNT